VRTRSSERRVAVQGSKLRWSRVLGCRDDPAELHRDDQASQAVWRPPIASSPDAPRSGGCRSVW